MMDLAHPVIGLLMVEHTLPIIRALGDDSWITRPKIMMWGAYPLSMSLRMSMLAQMLS